jgi:hypothetical protein
MTKFVPPPGTRNLPKSVTIKLSCLFRKKWFWSGLESYSEMMGLLLEGQKEVKCCKLHSANAMLQRTPHRPPAELSSLPVLWLSEFWREEGSSAMYSSLHLTWYTNEITRDKSSSHTVYGHVTSLTLLVGRSLQWDHDPGFHFLNEWDWKQDHSYCVCFYPNVVNTQ